MAETVGLHVEEAPLAAERPLGRRHRVERIAGRRSQDDARGLLLARPVLAGVELAEQLQVLVIPAAEGVDRARQLRKALHVAAGLELRLGDGGREPQHLRAVVAAQVGDQGLQPLHDRFEGGAAAIETVDPGPCQ